MTNKLNFFYKGKSVVITLFQDTISITIDGENITKGFKPGIYLEDIDQNFLRGSIEEYINSGEPSEQSFMTFFRAKIKEIKGNRKEANNLDSKASTDLNNVTFNFDEDGIDLTENLDETHFNTFIKLLEFLNANKGNEISNGWEIYENINYLCNGGENNWDGIDFESLYDDDKRTFMALKSGIQDFLSSAEYIPGSSSDYRTQLFLLLLDQGGLFNNQNFKRNKSELASNTGFLDYILENGTVSKILKDNKEPSADFKANLKATLQEFSSFDGVGDDLGATTKGWSGEELSAEDYFMVLFSDLDKSLTNERGESYLNFKTALSYFYNLLLSRDSILPLLKNDKVLSLFVSLKNDFGLTPNYDISLTKMYSKIIVKNIIIEKLQKEGVLTDFIRNLGQDLNGHYYFKFKPEVFAELKNLMLKREDSTTNDIKVEMAKKDKTLMKYLKSLSFEELNVNPSSDADVIKTPVSIEVLNRTNFSKSESSVNGNSGLKGEEILNQVQKLNENEQNVFIGELMNKTNSEEEFNNVLKVLFDKGNSALRETIFKNIFKLNKTSFQSYILTELFKDFNSNKITISNGFSSFIRNGMSYGILLAEVSKMSSFSEFLKTIFETQIVNNKTPESYNSTFEFFGNLNTFSKDKKLNKETIDSVLSTIFKNDVVSSELAKSPSFFKLLDQVEGDLTLLRKFIDLNNNPINEQRIFEYIKNNNLMSQKELNEYYFNNLMNISNFKGELDGFDLNSIKKVILDNSTDVASTLLNVIKEGAGKGLDAYKFLNLIHTNNFIETLSAQDRLEFYLNYVSLLNEGEYKDEETAIGFIFSNVLSQKANGYDLISKVQEELFSNKAFNKNLAPVLEIFKNYVNRISNNKSILGKASNFLTGLFKSEEEKDRENQGYTIMNDTVALIENEMAKLKGIENMISESNLELNEIESLLKNFRFLVENSVLKNETGFTTNLSVFESTLTQSRTRLQVALNTITDTLSSLENLKQTAKANLTVAVIQEELGKVVANLETINKNLS